MLDSAAAEGGSLAVLAFSGVSAREREVIL